MSDGPVVFDNEPLLAALFDEPGRDVVESYLREMYRGDLDTERGPTTSASGEVAANLPILRARNSLRERDTSTEDWALADASNCPDWIERRPTFEQDETALSRLAACIDGNHSAHGKR